MLNNFSLNVVSWCSVYMSMCSKKQFSFVSFICLLWEPAIVLFPGHFLFFPHLWKTECIPPVSSQHKVLKDKRSNAEKECDRVFSKEQYMRGTTTHSSVWLGNRASAWPSWEPEIINACNPLLDLFVISVITNCISTQIIFTSWDFLLFLLSNNGISRALWKPNSYSTLSLV